MNRYFNYFFSVYSALILMFIFGTAIGIATFIENDYGTSAAKSVVFNAWWLELILVLLCSIFIYNIYEYKLYHLKKIPILFLHISFIFIIIGAGITRYISEEGVMRIREGGFGNQFISTNLFLEFKVHNAMKQYSGEKELLLSSIANNTFSLSSNFEDNLIQIDYIDFIHDPIDQLLLNTDNGYEVLEFVVPSESGGMQSVYLPKYVEKNIAGLNVGFTSKGDSDFKVFQKDTLFYFQSQYDVQYMKMSDQSKGVLEKNEEHQLHNKTLYTILNNNIVFKNHFTNAVIHPQSSSIKNDPLKLDLLKIKISVLGSDTVINLYGGEGRVSPKEYFMFENLFFSFSYGPKIHTLPFAIFLKDFELDRYPGSNSPSSFASEIQVIDGEEKFEYRIFMNNVLNYKGYKFFQSSYDTDEKGTILSVNKDKWGTAVTYFGYLSLLLSILSLMISRFSRINILGKQINNSIS